MTPYWQSADGRHTLYCGDALQVLGELEALQVICADPPYHRVLNEQWDRIHASRADFLTWVSALCQECYKALAPNGSLLMFAFPDMASGVEETIRQLFNVLNHLVWEKANGGLSSRSNKAELRHFLNLSERIIFAEHNNSDQGALGASGYGVACERLRGFVFESIRSYLASEWRRAGLTFAEANIACGTASMAARHFFSVSQWHLPTAAHYAQLQAYANRARTQPYEYLRRDYEELRRDYEELRRPFTLTADEPYGDVLRFNTSATEGTFHPAQKPVALLTFLVRATSTSNALVCDPFTGSGTTGVACIRTGRRFIGIEIDEAYCALTVKRLEAELRQPSLFPVAPLAAHQTQAPLFPLEEPI